MELSLLLKDGRLMKSRTNSYTMEDLEKVLKAVSDNYELIIDGNYVAHGKNVKSLIISF